MRVMFDVLSLRHFFDASLREEILAQLRAGGAAPATVYGSGAGAAIQPRVRNVRLVEVSPALREAVTLHLIERRPEIEKYFDVELGDCEPPQFLRYESGDFFVAHQDGNTALLADDSRHRRVSIVIFLNEGYGGGALTLHGPYPDFDMRHAVMGEPGMLVAFRSETTHEVTPVTHGERYTIVSWYRSRTTSPVA
jgi:SM-20-related protein